MPLSWSSTAIAEKNKLTSNGVWLLLLSVEYTGETPVRIVYNNESITWPSSGGNVYYPMDFKLDAIEQNKDGSLPSVNLTIRDFERRITPHLDTYDGGVGADVYEYLVHSSNLAETTPEITETFKIMSASVNAQNIIQFELGASNLMNYRIPQDRLFKDHCRYKEFGGTLCGYSGAETTCNRTFAQCIDYENQARFGGAPGCGVGGYLA